MLLIGPVKGRASRTLQVFAMTCLLFPSGCGIYLHDSDLEKTTKATKENFAKLDFSAPFKEEQVRLKDFADREDLAVANLAAANRDQVLVSLIQPSPLDTVTGGAHAHFTELVEEDCKIVYGSCPDDNVTLQDLTVAPALISQRREAMRVATERYADAVLDFSTLKSKEDERKTDCKALAAPSGGTTEADIAYQRIGDACKEIAKRTSDPSKLTPPNPNDPPIDFAPAAGSAIGVTLSQLAEHESTLAAAKAEGKALAQKIKDINAKIEEANGAPDETLQGLIDSTKKTLDDAQPLAKLAGLEELQAALESAISGELKAPADAESAEAGKAGAAVQFVVAVAAASQRYAEADRATRVAMLVLALAAVKQQKDMAQIDADQAQSNITLDEQKLMVAMNWLARLAEAKLLLKKVNYEQRSLADVRKDGTRIQRAAMGEAIKAYTLSWDTGRAPYRILDRKEIQVQRAADAKRAELTARNFQTTLEPVLADLEAYGAGGIKPETIAQVLGHLGIMAAILGG